MTSKLELSRNHLAKNAGLTAGLLAAGAFTGLALDALILSAFGAGDQTDALFTALTIPTLLNSVLAIQGPKVLIPTFSVYFDSGRDDEAWMLLRNVFTVSAVVLAAVALVGAVLSSLIVPVQVPGLSSETISLGVRLSRILFLLVSFQGLSSIAQAVLYARHAYGVSSIGKPLTNVLTIALVLVAGQQRLGIEVVAWGMVLGNFVHLGFLGGVLAVHGFRYRWHLKLEDPSLRAMVTSFGYPLAGHILGESGTILQNVLGSYLGSGSLTLLRYASRIIASIGGILLGSIVGVTLPMMARHAASGDIGRQKRTLLESLQVLSIVGLPLCIWLSFIAEPLVVLLFNRGEFSITDAAMTAVIMRLMIPSFILTRFVNVSQQLFYANADTTTPFVSTVIFTITNAIVAMMLTPWLEARGLAVAISFASLSNSVYMFVKVQRTFGPIGWFDMRRFAWRLCGASVATAVAFALGSRAVSLIGAGDSLTPFLAVALPSSLGFLVFVVGVLVLRLGDPGLIAPVAGDAR